MFLCITAWRAVRETTGEAGTGVIGMITTEEEVEGVTAGAATGAPRHRTIAAGAMTAHAPAPTARVSTNTATRCLT